MKTPKEWLETFAKAEAPYRTEARESDIKAIQDEAFKAGMTRAAEIALIRPKGQQAAIDIIAERKKLP